MSLVDKLKDLSEIFTYIDKNIGFKKFVKYLTVILAIIVAFNFKRIVREIIEIRTEIVAEDHLRRMGLRDELLNEIAPILTELRFEMSADRVLYFEYHDGKENLVGIPFNYIELVCSNSKYGVTAVNPEKYSGINIGLINSLYQDLKKNGFVSCRGQDDSLFRMNFSGIHEFFNERDGSAQQLYANIPGIKQPIGMIIIEWMDVKDRDWDEMIETIYKNYISRINGVILSKRR